MKKEVTMPMWFYIMILSVMILNTFTSAVNIFKDEEPVVRVFYNGEEVTKAK